MSTTENDTVIPETPPAPLTIEQQQRVIALKEARKVLEARRSGPPFGGSTTDVPDSDQIICVAEYIYTGSIWMDDGQESTGVKIELENRQEEQ